MNFLSIFGVVVFSFIFILVIYRSLFQKLKYHRETVGLTVISVTMAGGIEIEGVEHNIFRFLSYVLVIIYIISFILFKRDSFFVKKTNRKLE